jgi:hypothetical protein
MVFVALALVWRTWRGFGIAILVALLAAVGAGWLQVVD